MMLKYVRNKVRVYVFIEDSRRSSLIVHVWPLQLDFVINVLSNIQVLKKTDVSEKCLWIFWEKKVPK